jgi:hypothetical protein
MTFDNYELLGRQMLTMIIPKLYNSKEYSIYPFLTDPNDTDKYDAFISVFTKGTYNLVANHLIEIKCRNKHYDELMLEKDKYDYLIKKSSECGADAFYINTTPKGTYIFNLSKMDSEIFKFKTEEHNVTSVNKANGKRLKKVCHLPVDKAMKVLNVTFDDVIESYQRDHLKLNREITKQQQAYYLFKWMLSKNQLSGNK